MSNRRFLVLALAAIALIAFISIFFERQTHPTPTVGPDYTSAMHPGDIVLQGEAIAGKLGNETAKAELGRAAWKLLHTVMARFPDKPTHDEQTALFSYIYLFARLYPCGECATHFRQILVKFPPQVSTRSTAAAWACHAHNEVNKSLKKEIFDCSNIGDFYDCGCADDEETPKEGAEVRSKDILQPEGGADENKKATARNSIKESKIEYEVEKGGLTLGG